MYTNDFPHTALVPLISARDVAARPHADTDTDTDTDTMMAARERRAAKKSGSASAAKSPQNELDQMIKKANKLAAPTIQAAGALSFLYASYWQMMVIRVPLSLAPNRDKFGGVLKYLTFLNMVLQFVFFTVALLANFTGKRSRLVRVRDVMFASAAFPIGMFVGLVFWGLWAIDRELIFPVAMDAYFPSWLNHLMHTTVLPLQVMELFLVRHTYPSRKVGGAITAALTLAYLLWINVIAYYGGFWVYPVFKVLTLGQRGGVMALLSGVGGLLYLAGEAANMVVWPPRAKAE